MFLKKIMEYDIDKSRNTFRLIPSTEEERLMLWALEQELDAKYGRKNYTLIPSARSLATKENQLESLSFEVFVF